MTSDERPSPPSDRTVGAASARSGRATAACAPAADARQVLEALESRILNTARANHEALLAELRDLRAEVRGRQQQIDPASIRRTVWGPSFRERS